MNILVFSWRGPGHPLAGGAEQVMHEHMKGWIEGGHLVTLFTSKYEDCKRKESIDGVKVVRQGIQYWGVQILGAIHYLFSGKKYDLVVDQFHGIPFFTPLYVQKPKLAVVQEVAREVWLKNDLPWPFNKIIGWIGYLGEPLLFLPYRRVRFITGSESARVEVNKMGIDLKNIYVIPHGVLVNDPGNIKKEKVKTIVFLGALAKDKGIEDAIETFGILNKKGKYQFWVIGKSSPKYIDILKNRVKKLNIQKNTTFFGYVTKTRKFELLKRARILINPSLLEGWGLVNIEANAMGTPVVGYTSPGLIDSINNGMSGYKVYPNTPENLAKNIDELMNNKTKYEKLSESCKIWSKKFDWKNSKKQSLQLIEKFDV